MKTRTISGAVLILVLFGLLYVGGYVWLVALAAFSEIGLYEYTQALSKQHKPYFWISAAACFAYYLILALIPDWIIQQNGGLLSLAILFMVFMIASVAEYPKRSYVDALLSFGGVVYIAVLFSFLYFVRAKENGFVYIWFLFWAAWGSDTCAYLFGRAFGKHKLVPVLSPNKTVEGALGGVFGAIVLCVGYGMAVRSSTGLSVGMMLVLSGCIGLFGAILGQIGDLFSSSIKRFVEIKDFGKLIPGHGGILDRFDSILLSGTAVALVLHFLGV